jgi:hypothetical protein
MEENSRLLRRIQEDAVTSSTPIGELLRRCQVFAARVGLSELDAWVRYELNGYPNDAELPEYRVFQGIAKGNFLGPFGSGLSNAVLPASNLPEQLRDWATQASLRQPIASLEDVAKDRDGNLTLPWPGDLIKLVQSKFYEGMSLGQAWLEISRSDVTSAIEAVRNRILAFALEAERYTEAGTESTDVEKSARLVQSFHTHIYGSVQNIAQGSSDFEQTAGVSPGDLGSLISELKRLGVPQDDLTALQDAVEEDGAQPKGAIGPRVAAWAGRVVAKAMSGASTIATNTASTVIPRLLERFYG